MASTRPDTDPHAGAPRLPPAAIGPVGDPLRAGWLSIRLCLPLIAALVLAGMLLAAGPARAGVQINPLEGPAVNLSLDQMPIPPDVNGTVYTIRSEDGANPVTVSGYSLAALLEAAGVDPITIGYVEVSRPGGGSLLLSRSQATTPGTFPEGPPVVFRDSEGIHLLRPSTGESDLNAVDLITLPLGTAISLQARSGTLIQVSADASPRRARVGQEIRFRATLDRSAAGEEVQISWYFDDGTSGQGAEVAHRFRRAGLYDVVVGVTTPNDRVGASATVTVQVGQPNKEGPNRRGGGTNKDSDAPDSGASEGRSGPASGPSSNGSSGPSYAPPVVDPGFSPPSPAPPPPAPRPTPIPEPAPEPPPERPEPPRPTGDEIVGELLSADDIADEPLAAITPPPNEADETVAARTGSAEPEGGGGGIPGAAMGVGAAILMLFGGGLLEARGIGRLRW